MIFSAAMVILLLSAILAGINSFRTTDQEDSYNVTTTSDNSSIVTLSQDLFNAKTYNASVVSNLTSDAPIASTYASATKKLTITGLTTNASRLLTVTYKIDSLEDFPGVAQFCTVWPLLMGLGVFGLIVGGIYYAFRSGGD